MDTTDNKIEVNGCLLINEKGNAIPVQKICTISRSNLGENKKPRVVVYIDSSRNTYIYFNCKFEEFCEAYNEALGFFLNQCIAIN